MTSEVKLWKAINLALHDLMREDENVIMIGQDIGAPGGTYGLSRGLLEEFGALRVRDAPISEAAITGAGIGAAMSGLRPIVEIMFMDFIALAMNQLTNQAAKMRFFVEDLSLPLVIQTLYGGRANMGAQHSQALEAWLCHIPGLKVAFPSNPQDAYDVLRLAVADPGPVVVIYPLSMLRERGILTTGGALTESHRVGDSRLVQSGSDITVVSYGPALALCEKALTGLEADADLIDLRWLQPWDSAAIAKSVQKTSRLLVVHDAVGPGGWGAEIALRTAEDQFWFLDCPPERVTGDFSALPVQTKDWEPLLPSVGKIREGIRRVLQT